MERYLRGFLDLLTVSFMSRYRHRPLHLFGGLGLHARRDRDRDPRLPDGRQAHRRADRTASAAPARGAARRRRHPVPLARPALRARHEPAPGAAADARRSPVEARRRDPALETNRVKVLYFGTYDRASPRNTQVVSCLRQAGVTVVERHREVWGRHELVGRARAARAGATGGGIPRAASRGRRGRRPRRLPGALRHAGRQARCARTPGRLQPSRLAPRHVRRRPGTVPPALAGGRGAASDRQRRVSRRRPRRRRHGGPRGVLPQRVRAAGGARRGGARRSRRAAVPARLASAGAVPRPLRREADPAPRHRHDPRRGGARPRGAVPRRRRRPARGDARAPARQRRARAVDPLRGAPRGVPGGRMRARRLRHRPEDREGHPEQGVPGARVREARDHGRHACCPRAPHGRRRRPARPSRAIPRRSPDAVRRVAADAELAGRLAAAGRETFEERASEDVLGERWRSLLERVVERR